MTKRVFAVIGIAIIVFTSLAAVTQIDWNTQIKNKPFVDAATCGLKMDGVTDDSTALSNCLNGVSPTLPASGVGRTLVLPPGIIAIASPVVITKDNIQIVGAGGWGASTLCHSEVPGNTRCDNPTIIRAIGTWTQGTSMITFDGSTNVKNISPGTSTFLNNPGLEKLDLDANNKASTVLRLKYVNGGMFDKLHMHDFTNVSLSTIYYALDFVSTSTANPGMCGNNGGLVHFKDIEITSYRPGAYAGMQLGTPGTTYDVCSNRFDNISIEISNKPGGHAAHFANTDSNEFSRFWTAGDNAGVSIGSITALTNSTATLIAPAHGIPPGTSDEGVFIFNGCTTPLVSGNCTGAEVPQVEGPFGATYVDANTLTISGMAGLIPATTYYAKSLFGIDMQFSGNGNSGGNLFSTVSGSVWFQTGAGGYGNYLNNWNWATDGNGANPYYQRMGGALSRAQGIGTGNFASSPSIHGNITHTGNGPIRIVMKDETGDNFGANQQASAMIWDGGQNSGVGAFYFQSLRNDLTFQANLAVLSRTNGGSLAIGNLQSSPGKAVCVNSAGNLGVCSSVVGSGGACTCN